MNQWPLFLFVALYAFFGFSVPAKAAPPETLLFPVVPAAESAAAKHILGADFQSIQRSVGDWRGRNSVYLNGKTSSVLFDRDTGLPVQIYNNSKTVGGSGPPQITSDEALARANKFLKITGVVLDGRWALMENKYFDSGREYAFTWRKMFYGIELASFVSILMDADDGQILNYTLIDDPVTIPLQVNISGEQALALVVEKKGWLHPVVKTADLQVWYPGGYPGLQALTWRFEIANPDATTGDDSYVRAEVNATAGNIVSLDGPAGFFKSIPKGKKVMSVALPKINVKGLRHAKLPPTVFQAARKKAK